MKDINNILTSEGGNMMNQQTYSTMLTELKEQEHVLIETINTSKQHIHEHEQIIKEAEQKLAELETGMRFISKWFLHETPAPIITGETEPSPAEMVKLSDATLEDAVKGVLGDEPSRKFTAREVAEILEAKGYPTRAKNFIDVVSNTLRFLTRDNKIEHKKTGKFVKYFAPVKLPEIKGGIKGIFDSKN
jgi:ABC-type Zn uptake system ZnuABC Zn-binding protein ZnuA